MATTTPSWRDLYPTVDFLVSGMQSRLNLTEKWDMVVSYSLDSLNSLIAQLWERHPTTGDSIILVSENINEDDETYHIKWTLRLGSPSLRFTYDGRAELTMALSGTYMTVEKSADGKERPMKTIPEATYVLVSNVPLRFVHITSEGVKPAVPEVSSGPHYSRMGASIDAKRLVHALRSMMTPTQSFTSCSISTTHRRRAPHIGSTRSAKILRQLPSQEAWQGSCRPG